MATKAYKWRTAPTGVEGTATRYVDSDTGSDIFGDGTRANPYQSLGKAWRVTSTKPSLIICRGFFQEMIADGTHVASINGDYYGAAVFDGADYHVCYGFRHSNMMFLNTGVGDLGLNVASGSGLFAGVGSAIAAGHVGTVNGVYGVAGSPVLMDRAGLYWGVAGGTSACRYNIYSRPKHNGTYKIALGSTSSQELIHNTFYGCKIADRTKKFTNGVLTLGSSIFADWDLFADETTNLRFVHCLFLADCDWYFGDEKLTITGVTSEEREASLISEMDRLEIPVASRPTFSLCKFSTHNSAEVFNDPENCDFTLRLTGDGVINESVYYGALAPALHVPVLDNSTGVAGSWDERTASGCVMVEGDAVVLDEESNSMSGELRSKIVTIDPTTQPINGIFATFASKFTGQRAYLSNVEQIGESYTADDYLPIGRYKVKGAIIYDNVNFGNGDIIVVTAETTKFANNNFESELIAITDANINNVVYVRCRASIYAKVTSADNLQRGGTYLNFGGESITYHGRTIAPKESFVAVNDTEKFTAAADYEVGVMFDDTRVPETEWVSAQMFGEYFVWKSGGVIMQDEDGQAVSSGNYLSYQTTANGGYSDRLSKRIINQAFVQFAIFVQKYDSI